MGNSSSGLSRDVLLKYWCDQRFLEAKFASPSVFSDLEERTEFVPNTKMLDELFVGLTSLDIELSFVEKRLKLLRSSRVRKIPFPLGSQSLDFRDLHFFL